MQLFLGAETWAAAADARNGNFALETAAPNAPQKPHLPAETKKSSEKIRKTG
jgi:hypothetical protein